MLLQPRCAQHLTTSGFRKKHADEVRDMRHAAWAKRQRAKHGETVKVQRRKGERVIRAGRNVTDEWRHVGHPDS